MLAPLAPGAVLRLDVLKYAFSSQTISHIPICERRVLWASYKETQEFVDNVRGRNGSNVGWKGGNWTYAPSTA